MSPVDRYVGLTVGVIAIIGALVTWRRAVKPLLRTFRAMTDTILGSEELLDRSGAVVQPAAPGITARMKGIEQQVEPLAATLQKVADQQSHLIALSKRVDGHDERLGNLEASAAERIIGRAESAQAYRTIEAAIQAHPDEPPESK